MPEAPRILIHAGTPAPLADRLAAAHPDAAIATCDTYPGLPDMLAAHRPDIVYGIRFAGTKGYPRDALLGAHGPRWIAVGGAGTDHLGPWEPARVTVTNAAGTAAGMMAEYILGSVLHFTLDVAGLMADQAARHWDAARMVTPIAGKTLLIVGLGHTGQALAARARAFGLTVLGTRARPHPMDEVDEVHPPDALPTLLARADIVAVCAPLTPATRGMIGTTEVAAIKDGAILVDVSRGGIVDHAALGAALASGRLRGAALDVFDPEPLPPDSPLWSLPNALISPHCSAYYAEWEATSFAFFLENLTRWRAGEPLLNVVDPARGY
ncbi:MAG: D-2-hydroxyacid dehydrogenase [Pseudomonadota bacterium]